MCFILHVYQPCLYVILALFRYVFVTLCLLSVLTPFHCVSVPLFLFTIVPLSHCFSVPDRLVGLVVKASASRAEDPGFEPRWRRDFFGVESYQ